MSHLSGGHVTDQEAEGLTIAAAALRIGVSENAVRQRIKRESIQARTIDAAHCPSQAPLVDRSGIQVACAASNADIDEPTTEAAGVRSCPMTS
jgi:hypothetical protein